MTFDVISEQVKNLVTKTLNDLDKSLPCIKYKVLNFNVVARWNYAGKADYV